MGDSESKNIETTEGVDNELDDDEIEEGELSSDDEKEEKESSDSCVVVKVKWRCYKCDEINFSELFEDTIVEFLNGNISGLGPCQGKCSDFKLLKRKTLRSEFIR